MLSKEDRERLEALAVHVAGPSVGSDEDAAAIRAALAEIDLLRGNIGAETHLKNLEASWAREAAEKTRADAAERTVARLVEALRVAAVESHRIEKGATIDAALADPAALGMAEKWVSKEDHKEAVARQGAHGLEQLLRAEKAEAERDRERAMLGGEERVTAALRRSLDQALDDKAAALRALVGVPEGDLPAIATAFRAERDALSTEVAVLRKAGGAALGWTVDARKDAAPLAMALLDPAAEVSSHRVHIAVLKSAVAKLRKALIAVSADISGSAPEGLVQAVADALLETGGVDVAPAGEVAPSPECRVVDVMSCMCLRGVKACVVDHAAPTVTKVCGTCLHEVADHGPDGCAVGRIGSAVKPCSCKSTFGRSLREVPE
jgi:hypothetical protein